MNKEARYNLFNDDDDIDDDDECDFTLGVSRRLSSNY